MKMEVADKAVSTEDLCLEQPHNTCLEVAKLEAVLNTLVENKVEAIKNETKSSSIHSSPKALINRLRITSTSTASSKEKDEHSESFSHSFENRKHRRRKDREKQLRRKSKAGRIKQRTISMSSPESARYSLSRCCERTPPMSDEENQEVLEFLKYENICNPELCIPADHNIHSCCCNNGRNGQIRTSYDEDYVSLKIEDFDDADENDVMAQEARRRAKRKRRRRRKRRIKRQIAITAIPVEETVKVIDPEELPQRARWTIVATAFLLLFMCLLLVGVTLRMAPIIDDMVRKENEELMNSLHRDHGYHNVIHNSTSPVPL